jgi:hypothetical protein
MGSSCLRIRAARNQECIKLLLRVGLELCAPVPAGAHVHAGDEVAEERHHLDCVEAQHNGELLLQDTHDLEGLEQLDDPERLQRPQQEELLWSRGRGPSLGADLLVYGRYVVRGSLSEWA